MRFYLLVYLLMSCVSVQATVFGNESNIKGDCNVVVQDSDGVTVNPTCINLPEKAVQALESYLNQFLGDAGQHKRQLQRQDKLLSLQESEISQLHQQIEEWVKRYQDLETELKSVKAIGDISQALLDQALAALETGDLDKAGQLLDELIAQLDEEKFEQEQQQRAKIYYSRALVHEQQYEPLKALPLYKKAHRYAPDNIYYGFNYAKLLQEQNEFKQAARIYETILDELQILANEDDSYLNELATTQNNLGLLYADTTRYELAEQHYKNALDTYEQLAKINRLAFLPYVATTSRNMAIFYFEQEKNTQAVQYAQQAIDLFRPLAKSYPPVYGDKFAATVGLMLEKGQIPNDLCAVLKDAIETVQNDEVKQYIVEKNNKLCAEN